MKKRFYKKKGYYVMTGNSNIEFCCEKFDEITGNKKSRFSVLISNKPKRGYSKFSLKPTVDIYKEKNISIWSYCRNEILKEFGSDFWVKIKSK